MQRVPDCGEAPQAAREGACAPQIICEICGLVPDVALGGAALRRKQDGAFESEARAIGNGPMREQGVAPGIAVQHRATKRRQQVAFINRHAGRAARTVDVARGNYAGIILMPLCGLDGLTGALIRAPSACSVSGKKPMLPPSINQLVRQARTSSSLRTDVLDFGGERSATPLSRGTTSAELAKAPSPLRSAGAVHIRQTVRSQCIVGEGWLLPDARHWIDDQLFNRRDAFEVEGGAGVGV